MVRLGILWIGVGSDDGWERELIALLRTELSGILPMQQQGATPQQYVIEETLRRWCDEEELDLLITIGGTFPAPGPSGLEIAPEALSGVTERAVPSLPEAMRAHARVDHPMALLDRSVAGIRGRTLLLNLPGEQGLSLVFLEGIVHILQPILFRLRGEDSFSVQPASPFMASEDEDDTQARHASLNEPSEEKTGLNADEFASFLRRRRETSDE